MIPLQFNVQYMQWPVSIYSEYRCWYCCLCFQVNGRGAKEAERDSKLSVSPSPSNASSNASLVTPPTNTPPEVPNRKYLAAHQSFKNIMCSILVLYLYLFFFHHSGFDDGRHPSAQFVPAAGQRACSPETLQQESAAHGLDQEKWTLQQPIGHLSSPQTHT